MKPLLKVRQIRPYRRTQIKTKDISFRESFESKKSVLRDVNKKVRGRQGKRGIKKMLDIKSEQK